MAERSLTCYTTRPAISQCNVNLVANPGFQTTESSPVFTLDHWQPKASNDEEHGAYGSGEGRDGGVSLRLSITSTELNTDMGFYQQIATIPDNEYYVEFWYYLETVQPQTDGAMYCRFGGTWFPDVAVVPSSTQETWVKISDTLTASTASSKLECYIHGTSIFNMRLDDFNVQIPCPATGET